MVPTAHLRFIQRNVESESRKRYMGTGAAPKRARVLQQWWTAGDTNEPTNGEWRDIPFVESE